MSGVYIKGMEMPTRCYTCPCADLEFYDCNLMPGTRIEQHKRLDDCPLIPVPPHGRLIDADALYRKIKAECNPYGKPSIGYDDGLKVLGIIGSTPPVIPAEDADYG